MSESAKKKRNRVVSESHGKAANKKNTPPVKDQKLESEAIERAVYDGMQDLRMKKPG